MLHELKIDKFHSTISQIERVRREEERRGGGGGGGEEEGMYKLDPK